MIYSFEWGALKTGTRKQACSTYCQFEVLQLLLLTETEVAGLVLDKETEVAELMLREVSEVAGSV
jgi:hypothetical protein